MKTLGINIDGVVRDFYAQFDKQYRKAFINNPNLVGMNKDMTVKEMTEEEWEALEERIKLREKELISLPLDSYELTNHYRFEGEKSLDGETQLTPEEALNEFLNEKYPFQIYGQAEEYEGACDAVNRIQAHGLRNNLYNTVFISTTKSPAIPATFHFLAKNASRIRNVVFVDNDSDKWDHCDIMIDCVPEVIQNTPEDKTIIKIEHPFNQWDETEHSFKSIKEINPNFIEELLVGEKKS
jgi:hypothetical protein